MREGDAWWRMSSPAVASIDPVMGGVDDERWFGLRSEKGARAQASG